MDDARGAIEAVWRIEGARVIAAVARIVRDVGLAEELAHDALVAALERWPADGVPANPGAWLVATAKNRAFDRTRHAKMAHGKHESIAATATSAADPREAVAAELDDPFASSADADRDLLRLVFTCCHPVLADDARVALTLRMLGGLQTDEIARAFVVPEPTIAQRIVRAKRTLADARVPFEVPRAEELADRLAPVLAVIYLVFNEGYSATTGDDWMRPALCDDALRLARILATLLPGEPEVHALLALVELTASRTPARTNARGEPILLLDQNRTHWDRLLIQRGLAALARGEALAGDDPGPYLLQAQIAACHARAPVAADTDWRQIALVYATLARLSPSPIVELNRAVAVAMAYGPALGLTIVDALVAEGALARYHLLPSVRADLLAKLGRTAEARDELARAAALTNNARERELLLARAAALPA